MRAVFFAFLILAGLGVLAWATAKPNDGRANANAVISQACSRCLARSCKKSANRSRLRRLFLGHSRCL